MCNYYEGWFCPNCDEWIEPLEVTYEETHDREGCGADVEWREDCENCDDCDNPLPCNAPLPL